MVGSNRNLGSRRRWVIILSVFALALSIVVGVFLWSAVELRALTSIAADVTQAKPLMSGLRLSLIALLAIVWPIIGTVGGFSDDGEAEKKRWLALRWRLVGWLLVIELMIGQDLVGQLLVRATDVT